MIEDTVYTPPLVVELYARAAAGSKGDLCTLNRITNGIRLAEAVSIFGPVEPDSLLAEGWTVNGGVFRLSEDFKLWLKARRNDFKADLPSRGTISGTSVEMEPEKPAFRTVQTHWLAGLPNGTRQIDGTHSYRYHPVYDRYSGHAVSIAVTLPTAPVSHEEPFSEPPKPITRTDHYTAPTDAPRPLQHDFDSVPGGEVRFTDGILTLDGEAIDVPRFLATVDAEESLLGHAYDAVMLKAVMRRCISSR